MPKKLTQEEFVQKAKEAHGDKYDYSKVNYINNRTKIIITCPVHGDFEQIPNKHLLGRGCNECGKIKRSQKLIKQQEDFLDECRKIHGDKYDYTNTIYKGSMKSINVNCLIHGDFKIQANHHIEGYGCKKCGHNKLKPINENNKVTNIYAFVSKAKIVHNSKYNYNKSVYKGSKSELIITCPIHGDFKQRINAHLQGQGCPICKQSHTEQFIMNLLQENDIEFECQGRQHFISIDFFGGKKGYQEINNRDIKKKQLCEKHKIKILYYCNDKRNIYKTFLNTTLYTNEKLLLEEIKRANTL